jgi:hypothetical protein
MTMTTTERWYPSHIGSSLEHHRAETVARIKGRHVFLQQQADSLVADDDAEQMQAEEFLHEVREGTSRD